MSKRDRRHQKKQKRRQERIRQEKHQQRGPPFTAGLLPWARETAKPIDRDIRPHPGLDGDMERFLRLAVWTTERIRPDGGQALTDFLQERMGSDRWRQDYAAMIAADPAERAQDLAFQAMDAEADGDESGARRLATKALEADPDNCDALGVLLLQPRTTPGVLRRLFGAAAPPPEDCLERCLAALHRSLRSPTLAQEVRRGAGDAWGRVVLRPFLRTAPAVLHRLALDDRDPADALDLAEAVFALDRFRDPSHADRLVGLYLATGRREDARRLLDREVDDDASFAPWARAWERFLAGDRRAARIQVDRGRAAAPMVEEILRGDTTDTDETDDGDDARAAALLGVSLRRDEALGQWFADGCCATTPEERAAAPGRYRGPEAALLAVGAVDTHTVRHRERIAALGLPAAAFPDLLRMADDQALHELPEDDPAVWAPLHAVVALTHLGPSAGPLGDLLPVVEHRVHDEWLAPRLRRTVAGYGGQALTAMGAWLADLGREAELRSFAADVLVQVAEDDTANRDHVVALLVRELKRHEVNPPQVNAAAAAGLASLGAVAAEPLVKACYDAGTIDRGMAGPFEAWRAWARETPAEAARRRKEMARFLGDADLDVRSLRG